MYTKHNEIVHNGNMFSVATGESSPVAPRDMSPVAKTCLATGGQAGPSRTEPEPRLSEPERDRAEPRGTLLSYVQSVFIRISQISPATSPATFAPIATGAAARRPTAPNPAATRGAIFSTFSPLIIDSV